MRDIVSYTFCRSIPSTVQTRFLWENFWLWIVMKLLQGIKPVALGSVNATNREGTALKPRCHSLKVKDSGFDISGTYSDPAVGNDV